MRIHWKIGAVLAVAVAIMVGWVFRADIRYRLEYLLGHNRVHWVNKVPNKLKRRGVAHHVISSQVLGHPVGVAVYKPENPTKPESLADARPNTIIYFLHGRGGTEVSDAEGVLDTILPLFAELQLPEPVVVFPNSGLTAYRAPYEQMFFDELMPQIESVYLGGGQQQIGVKRMLMGFSFGGFGALRYTLREPRKFSGLFSFAGGLYSGDAGFMARTEEVMPTLRDSGFSAYFINGEWDRPEAFTPLVRLWSAAGIDVHRIVLPETPHALGLYLERSRGSLGEFFATVLGSQR